MGRSTMTYRLMTRYGQQASASIATRYDLSDYDFVLEVDDNSKFLDIATIATTVTYSNGRVEFSLTPTQVDQIQNKYFRVVGLHKTNNTHFYFVNGTIDYTPRPTIAQVRGDILYLVDANGVEFEAGNVRGAKGDKGDKGNSGDLTVATSSAVSGNVVVSSEEVPSTFLWTLAGDIIIGDLPPGPEGVAGTVTLIIRQATSGGPYTVTWPTNIGWANGSLPPVAPSVAGREMMVHLFWAVGSWRGLIGSTFF